MSWSQLIPKLRAIKFLNFLNIFSCGRDHLGVHKAHLFFLGYFLVLIDYCQSEVCYFQISTQTKEISLTHDGFSIT